MRIFNLSLFAILSIFIFSCSSTEKKKETEQTQKKGGPNQRPPVRADAFIAKTTTIFDQLQTPGTLVSNEAVDVHPEVGGRITGIYFKEGSMVKKGSMLFKLNDADLQAQKQKLLVQIKIAEQNKNRSEELLKIGGISRQDYENTELTVSNAQADLAVVNTQIEKTNIRAPFSGKVGLRLVSMGAYVAPTTTLTSLTEVSQMKIDFTVPEKYIPKIKLGQFIKFTVEGSNDRNYTGRVIASQSNITQNTRTLQVRAVVQGDQAGLVPGSFATVTVEFEPDPNAIMVPTQAIVPQARGKKVYVYQGGIAKFVDVTTGIRDSANIQILTGLKPGDTILLTGLLSMKPEGKVMLGRVVNGTKQPGNQQQEDSTKHSRHKQ